MKIHCLAFAVLAPVAALAQSDAASQVSAVSAEPASVAVEAAFEAIPEGTRWIVKGVANSATGASVVIEASGHAAVVSVGVSLEVAGELAHATGKSVDVVATSTGHVIRLGSETIAYVPNALGREMLHHRELTR